MRAPSLASAAVLIVLAMSSVVWSAQRTVRASTGWVKLSAEGATETTAFVTVENGTMYDVYIVGASSDVAGIVEVRQAKSGGPAQPVKEVTVPAYDRLDMAPDRVHIYLGQLKRPLKAGEEVVLSLEIAESPAISIAAVVK